MTWWNMAGGQDCVCTVQTPWEEVLCISKVVQHLSEASCAQLLYPFSVGCIQSYSVYIELCTELLEGELLFVQYFNCCLEVSVN